MAALTESSVDRDVGASSKIRCAAWHTVARHCACARLSVSGGACKHRSGP